MLIIALRSQSFQASISPVLQLGSVMETVHTEAMIIATPRFVTLWRP